MVQILPDQNVEDTEIFQVSINSTDVAVSFINDTSVVTIEDANIGRLMTTIRIIWILVLKFCCVIVTCTTFEQHHSNYLKLSTNQ